MSDENVGTDEGDILSDVAVPASTSEDQSSASRSNQEVHHVADEGKPEDVRDTVGNADKDLNPERPAWLPEKFKSPEDLVKAYNELGGKLREKLEPPEVYDLKMPEGVEAGLTEDDTKAFKEIGLTNQQAQKLVEYFHANIVPEIQNIRKNVEMDRLSMAWNMPSTSSHEFAQRLVEVKSWAMRNLPEAAVSELAKTANGVNALYKMMQAGVDAKSIQPSQATRLSKKELQDLMQDPRYINRDPDYMAYVQQKFKETFDQ